MFRYTAAVEYCHQHNLVDPDTAHSERHFGIRVTLPPNDTLRRILGNEWEKVHCDLAFEKMATRHGYYRNTDSPSQVLEKLVR